MVEPSFQLVCLAQTAPLLLRSRSSGGSGSLLRTCQGWTLVARDNRRFLRVDLGGCRVIQDILVRALTCPALSPESSARFCQAQHHFQLFPEPCRPALALC